MTLYTTRAKRRSLPSRVSSQPGPMSPPPLTHLQFYLLTSEYSLATWMEDLCAVDSSFNLLAQIVVYFGSACSIISVLNNSLIFWALATHRDRFTCYFQYLMLLSFFDVFVSFSYIPVITIDHLKDVLQSLPMARAWWQYFGVMLAVTHVAMTASYYLLLGASIERFCITTRSRFLHLVQTRRTTLCTLAILLALFTKAPIVFELDLLANPNCTGTVAEYLVTLSELSRTNFYGTFFRFWLRNFCTVFLPFFLLAYFNMRIVSALKQQFRFARTRTRLRDRSEDHKRRVRSATRMLVLVVMTYLSGNVINVVVTAWEFVDIDGLIDNHFDFYMSSTDLVSLLTTLGCAVRLPIYMSCNKELRRVIMNRLGYRRIPTDDAQSVNLQFLGVTQNLLYEHFEGIKPAMRLLRPDRTRSSTDERRLMMNVL